MQKGQVFKFPTPSRSLTGVTTKGLFWSFNKGTVNFDFIKGTANGYDNSTIEPGLFTNTLPYKLQKGEKVRSIAVYCAEDFIFSLGGSLQQAKFLEGGRYHIFDNIEVEEAAADMQEDTYTTGHSFELFYSLECVFPVRMSDPESHYYLQRAASNLTDTDATVFLKKVNRYREHTLILTSATNGATYTIQVQNNDIAGAWVDYQTATAIAAGNSAIVQITGVFYRLKVIAKNTVAGNNASLSGSLQGSR